MLHHHQAPLLETLQTLRDRGMTLFCTPGHKQGHGVSEAIATLMGSSVFQVDFPDLPGLNLFETEGVLAKSQVLAAETFGAERTWFLVNGSSGGVMAAILAICGTQDKIILSRTAHQSAIAGLILSGAWPVFVHPEYDPSLDLVYCPTPETIEQALREHPEAKAVLIVSPTYQGICADVAAIAAITHAHNIPLIVDEAHGAHFGFHPRLPPSALTAGADLVIQSTHKVLSAFTQASMLHLQGTRIDAERIQRVLKMLQSTSPSNLLLASLDAARQQMATEGYALMEHTLMLAEEGRSQLKSLGLSILDDAQVGRPGYHCLDLTRLTVQVSAFGLDGFTVDALLQGESIFCELPTFQQVTFILTAGNTVGDLQCLTSAFKKILDANGLTQSGAVTGLVRSLQNTPLLCSPQSLQLTPREAFFSASAQIKVEQAAGRISTEVICSYPPGIPILLPGEPITQDAIEMIQSILSTGGFVTGGSDATCQSFRVVA
jgi:arginine/lysine/ornithine decarboxylase